ncbi:MAG TPA: FAD-dependent oxidoreductase, partial [Pirellulales bacterium]|nr:FAD-dependent oxidoreductase [Pirellulales bacterium]
GHQVRRVDHDDKSVVIDTSQGEFTADFAVVTLPLGVLKHRGVEFHPALPERKRDAVQRMGMGLLNKTYLKFPRQFWPARADWLGFVSETKGRWSEYLNVAKFLAQPVLLGFTAATFARRTEKKTDQEIVAGMIAALRSMFGGRKVPDPLDVRITRWASDPFSYGSYSFMKTGSTPEDYEHLAEPVDNRLFFAGEHTSRRYSATVHGAYLSGIRAAKRIGAQV